MAFFSSLARANVLILVEYVYVSDAFLWPVDRPRREVTD